MSVAPAESRLYTVADLTSAQAVERLLGLLLPDAVTVLDGGAFDGDGVTVRVTPAGGRVFNLGEPARQKASGTAYVRVPGDDDFDGRDFLADAGLSDLFAEVVGKYSRLHLIEDHGISVSVLWKRKGGKKQGTATYAKCQKPSGLLAHFCTADFVIWVGADNVREQEWTTKQLEKLLYHEGRHISWFEGDEEKGKDPGPIIVGHDLEIFVGELEDTGEWEYFRRAVASEFRQTSMLALAQS